MTMTGLWDLSQDLTAMAQPFCQTGMPVLLLDKPDAGKLFVNAVGQWRLGIALTRRPQHRIVTCLNDLISADNSRCC